MSEPNGSATSLLAGNPGNPPHADGGTPGGAPPATPPTGTPPATPPASGDWLSGLGVSDPEVSAWATSKGWKSPADALTSHRQLEKLLGSEKVPLPKDANDAEGWDRLFKAAGRPDAPEAYGLDKIEGADPEFTKGAAAAFHAAGLNPTQAAKLVEFYGSQAKAALEAQETAFAQQTQVEIADLRKDWGPAFDAKLEAAIRATKLAGVDTETAQKIERAIGVRAATELFNRIGEATSESTFRTAGQGGGDQFLTPAAAAAEKAALLKDPAFVARRNAGDAGAKAQLERLQRIEAGLGA